MKWIFAVLFVFVGLAGVGVSPAGEMESTAIARKFAGQLLDGEHTANAPLMNETMRGAADEAAWEQLRAGLTASNGAVREIGDAWIEDRAGGLLRLRVPVSFERARLDFRIVLDDAGKVAGMFVVPPVDPPAEPSEAEREPAEIEISLGQGERAIPGVLSVPDGAGPFPAVIVIHGSGPSDRDGSIGPNRPYRDLARGLVERGVACLRYDKRSLARPEDLMAVGQRLTVQHEVIDDVLSALALLRQRKEIDASRIFLAGHSLGGMLLPRIAAAEPRPAGLIALAAATDPRPEVILEQVRYIAGLDGEVTAAEKVRLDFVEQQTGAVRAALNGEQPDPPGFLLGVPVGYFRDLARHDPPAETAALALPTLVLQGERDYQVTLEDFGRWRTALSGKGFACLVSYPGLDHHFRKGSGPSGPGDLMGRAAPFDPQVVDDIAGWIADRSCPES